MKTTTKKPLNKSAKSNTTVMSASEAARILNSIKTPRRAAAARNNGKLGGRPRGTFKPLNEYPCTCGGCPKAPKTTCPRGLAIYRRKRSGNPLTDK